MAIITMQSKMQKRTNIITFGTQHRSSCHKDGIFCLPAWMRSDLSTPYVRANRLSIWMCSGCVHGSVSMDTDHLLLPSSREKWKHLEVVGNRVHKDEEERHRQPPSPLWQRAGDRNLWPWIRSSPARKAKLQPGSSAEAAKQARMDYVKKLYAFLSAFAHTPCVSVADDFAKRTEASGLMSESGTTPPDKVGAQSFQFLDPYSAFCFGFHTVWADRETMPSALPGANSNRVLRVNLLQNFGYNKKVVRKQFDSYLEKKARGFAEVRSATGANARDARSYYKAWMQRQTGILGTVWRNHKRNEHEQLQQQQRDRVPAAGSTSGSSLAAFIAVYRKKGGNDIALHGSDTDRELAENRLHSLFWEYVVAFDNCDSDLERVRLLDAMARRGSESDEASNGNVSGGAMRVPSMSHLLRRYEPQLQELRHYRARAAQMSAAAAAVKKEIENVRGRGAVAGVGLGAQNQTLTRTEIDLIPSFVLLEQQEDFLKEIAALYATQLWQDCNGDHEHDGAAARSRISEELLLNDMNLLVLKRLLQPSLGIVHVDGLHEGVLGNGSGGVGEARTTKAARGHGADEQEHDVPPGAHAVVRRARVSMGQGKTAVMTPLLLKILANAQKVPIVVFADPLYSTATRDLQEALSAFDMRVLPLAFALSSSNTLPRLLALLSDLTSALSNGNVVFATRAKALQGIFSAGEKAWEDLRLFDSRELLLSFSVPLQGADAEASEAAAGGEKNQPSLSRSSSMHLPESQDIAELQVQEESAAAGWKRYASTLECLHQLQLRYRRMSPETFAAATLDPEEPNVRSRQEIRRGSLEDLFEELSTHPEGRAASPSAPFFDDVPETTGGSVSSGRTTTTRLFKSSESLYPCDRFTVEGRGSNNLTSMKYKIEARDADRMLEAAWRASLLQKKVEAYEKLRGLLETQAAVLYDEGDSILHSRKQLNYPMGEPEPLSPDGVEVATFILHEMLVERAQHEQLQKAAAPVDSPLVEERKRLVLDEVMANAQSKTEKNYLSKRILLPLADVLCENIRRVFRESPGAQRSDILSESTDSNFLKGCAKYLRHAIENDPSASSSANMLKIFRDWSFSEATPFETASTKLLGADSTEAAPAAGDKHVGATTTGREASSRPEYEIMMQSAEGFYKALSTVNTRDPRWQRLLNQLSVAKVYLHPMILDAFEQEVGKDFGWSIEDQELEAAIPYKAADQPSEMPGEISLIKDPWECLLKTVMTKLASPFWQAHFSDERGPNTYGRAFRQAKSLLQLLLQELFELDELRNDHDEAMTEEMDEPANQDQAPDGTEFLNSSASAPKSFRLQIKSHDQAFSLNAQSILTFAYEHGKTKRRKQFFFAFILREELGLNVGTATSARVSEEGTDAQTRSSNAVLAEQISHYMRQKVDGEEEDDENTGNYIAHHASGIPSSMVVRFARFIHSLQTHRETSRRVCFLQLMLWYQVHMVFLDTKHIRRYSAQVSSGPMELVFAGRETFAWSGTNSGRFTWQMRLQPPLTKTFDLAFVHESDTDPAESTRQQLLQDNKTAVLEFDGGEMMREGGGFQSPIDHFASFYKQLREQQQLQGGNIAMPRVSAFIDVGALLKGQSKRLVACGMLYYVNLHESDRTYIAFWEDLNSDVNAMFMYSYEDLFGGNIALFQEGRTPGTGTTTQPTGDAGARAGAEVEEQESRMPRVEEVAAHCQRRIREIAPVQLANGQHDSFVKASKEEVVEDLSKKLFTWFDQPRTLGSDVPRDDGSSAFVSVSERTGKNEMVQGVQRMRGFPFGMQHIAFVVDKRTKAQILKFRSDWFYPVQAHDCVRFSLSFSPDDAALREAVLGLVIPATVEPNQGTTERESPTYNVCVLASEADRLRRKYERANAKEVEDKKKSELILNYLRSGRRDGVPSNGVTGGLLRMASSEIGGSCPAGSRRYGFFHQSNLTSSTGMMAPVSCAGNLPVHEVHYIREAPRTDAEHLAWRGKHWFEPDGNLSMTDRLNHEPPLSARADTFYSFSEIPARDNKELRKQDVIAHTWWVQERTERKAYADALVMQVRAIVKRPLQFWRSFLSEYKRLVGGGGASGAGAGAGRGVVLIGSSALQDYAPRTRFRENDCAEVDAEEIPGYFASRAHSPSSSSQPQAAGGSAPSNKIKVFIRGDPESHNSDAYVAEDPRSRFETGDLVMLHRATQTTSSGRSSGASAPAGVDLDASNDYSVGLIVDYDAANKLAGDVLLKDRDLDRLAQTFQASARDLLLTLEDGSLWKQMGVVQELTNPVLMVDVFAARMMREVRWRFTHVLPPELLDALKAALKDVVTRASIYSDKKFRGLPERMMATSGLLKSAFVGEEDGRVGEEAAVLEGRAHYNNLHAQQLLYVAANANENGTPFHINPDGGASNNSAEVQLQLDVQLEQEALREANVERFMVTEKEPAESTEDSGWGLPELESTEKEFAEEVVPETSTLFEREGPDVFVPWFGDAHAEVEGQTPAAKHPRPQQNADKLRQDDTDEDTPGGNKDVGLGKERKFASSASLARISEYLQSARLTHRLLRLQTLFHGYSSSGAGARFYAADLVQCGRGQTVERATPLSRSVRNASKQSPAYS
eukprot:g271.t1